MLGALLIPVFGVGKGGSSHAGTGRSRMRSSRRSDQQPHASISGKAPPIHQPLSPWQRGQPVRGRAVISLRCRSAA
ncbi:hypothetical protein [Streptomyces sp. NBC_01471]|uniref:hypothetical protein n=1 Tax=Streptomyces sp. NBC_01471 TaxID=2903879 RepID=UPI00352F869C